MNQLGMPSAHELGYKAYWSQGATARNPYPERRAEHGQWQKGWDKAARDDRNGYVSK